MQTLTLDSRPRQLPMKVRSCGSQPANISLINRREGVSVSAHARVRKRRDGKKHSGLINPASAEAHHISKVLPFGRIATGVLNSGICRSSRYSSTDTAMNRLCIPGLQPPQGLSEAKIRASFPSGRCTSCGLYSAYSAVEIAEPSVRRKPVRAFESSTFSMVGCEP